MQERHDGLVREGQRSFVDLAPMFDREHENCHRLILDSADRSPVPDTIPPGLSELRAFQRGAMLRGSFSPSIFS